MAKARKCKKLKNGQYTCVVFLGKDPATGKQISQRVTGRDLTECRKAADRVAFEARDHKRSMETFSTAIADFMQLQEPMVSPNTYRDYGKYKRKLEKFFPDFCAKRCDRIRREDVQVVLNRLRKNGLASKTISNYWGFISRILKFKGCYVERPTLPEKTRPDIYVPTDDEIRRLLKAVSGTDAEIPVLLAVFGPLREGEISALEPSDLKGCVVHVHSNLVYRKGGWIRKETPKTVAGNRMVELPQFVVDRIGGEKPTELTPRQIYYRFKKSLKRAELQDFRFHDLRHYCASTLHAQGIPDAYIMRRGGWSTDATLKAVYRHTMADQDRILTDRALTHFSTLV